MDSFITDVRYGVRMLWKTPGLTIVATLTIALGVGLTTHTFSVVYGSILRGLDFDRGTPLISLSQDIPSQGSRGGSVPILDLLDWRERQTSFRGLAGFLQGNTINLADEGHPQSGTSAHAYRPISSSRSTAFPLWVASSTLRRTPDRVNRS